MNKVLGFQVPNSTEITNEVVGSILIHLNPQTAVPAVANISNLNKIKIGLFLKRGNRKEENLFDGYLGDLLQILHSGSTKLETVIEKTSIGYLFLLEFDMPIYLGQNDKLTLKTDFGKPSDSFTSAVLTGSTVIMYSNPSTVPNPRNLTAVYKSYPVGTGEVDFEKQLGNAVSKIVIDSHPTETFNENSSTDDSHDAKPLNCEIFANGFTEERSQVELLSLNQMKLAYNPDSDVKNLVAYESSNLIDSVKAKIKFDLPANNHTKVLVKQYIQA
jgi:hypothetical protein